jgi:hypothetical protein
MAPYTPVLIALSLLCNSSAAQLATPTQTVPNSLRDRLQPAEINSGFRMPGYFIWCASVIKVDDTYHMFAARWPVATTFPEGYRLHSEIVRATSSKPEGPYAFQEVVIGKRAAGKWDSGMAHNPAIYKVKDTFVLFYIGSDEGLGYRQVGVATASAITGPWVRSAQPLDLGINSDANNPAACFEPDGSVKLVWRNKDLRVYVSTASSYRGPYKVANDNVWRDPLEDFSFFKAQGRYHLICEDATGKITGHKTWGAHLYSSDGIHDWREFSPATVYDHDIRRADGTVFHAIRRERPWLLIEQQVATHLFTAVFDGQQTWNQPVPLQPGYALAP